MHLPSNSSLTNVNEDSILLFNYICFCGYILFEQLRQQLGSYATASLALLSQRLRRSSQQSIRFLRKLKFIRSSRINIRINNSLCSSRLKRELYQYSDRKSAIHCPRERSHHRTLSLLNLPSVPDELFLRTIFLSHR